MNNPEKSAKNRRTVLLLAVVCFGPLLAAYVIYFYLPEYVPDSTTNKGNLIAPAKPVESVNLRDVSGNPLPASPFQEQWTLLFIGPSECDDTCREVLWKIRQVRLRLGKDAQRVQRIYAAIDVRNLDELQRFIEDDHPGMQLLVARGADAGPFLEFFSLPGDSIPQHNNVYVLDPLGNWVLYFTADDGPGALYKDMKKLLRLSRIG